MIHCKDLLWFFEWGEFQRCPGDWGAQLPVEGFLIFSSQEVRRRILDLQEQSSQRDVSALGSQKPISPERKSLVHVFRSLTVSWIIFGHQNSSICIYSLTFLKYFLIYLQFPTLVHAILKNYRFSTQCIFSSNRFSTLIDLWTIAGVNYSYPSLQ